MLWMIGFGIIGLIAAVRFMLEQCYGFISWFFGVMGILVFTFIMFLLGIIPALITGIPFEKQWVETGGVKLLSLRNNDGMKGNFYLGCGSIESKQYYFFHKEKDAGYQPGKVEADKNVVVYEEDERHDGSMKIYTREFANTSWALELIAQCWPSNRYEFFIPAGSLKKNFVLQ